MLQNDYLLAKIGADTAENEPYVKSDVLPFESRRREESCRQVRDATASVGLPGVPLRQDRGRAVIAGRRNAALDEERPTEPTVFYS